MGARFPPAQGPAVDSPEYSTNQCKTVQSHAHETMLPAARQGLHRLTSTGRHVAAKAPGALEPDIASAP